jgi:hypothetical protein
MTRHASLLVLAAALSFTGTAGAEVKPTAPTGETDVGQARQRFARGVELYKEGSYDAALAEFNKAYEIAPNYRVLYNIAQVQRERHDYVAALRLFQQYLDQGGAEVTAERKDQVAKEITALKARVAEVQVKADVEGGELWVDGTLIGVLPLGEPLLVSAGVRQVELRKPGFITSSKSLTIAGGEEVKVDFVMRPDHTNEFGPTPAAVRHDVEPEPVAPVASKKSKVPMWVSLAAAGAFTGGAVTFGVLTKKSDDKLDQELSRPDNAANIESARDELKRNALITDIFTGAAIVSTGLFVYFAVSGASSGSAVEAKAVPARPTLKIGVMGAGLRAFGEF